MSTSQSSAPSSLDSQGLLVLRDPLPTDEAQVLAAQSELAEVGFNFTLRRADQTWEQYLDKVERDRAGINLSLGRVPATMLFAAIGNQIVGRVHVRHELTPALLVEGGHIGYCVRPAHRRRGYATEMLRQGLRVVRSLGIERALVTCDDDNQGSISTIERCGGVLEDTVAAEGSAPKRRYWIDLR
ncbi:hypothetical protein GCM10027404_32350 [Arthrobacter tumbae]|uniref:GNAT family N-acetyltransferase n=1 Tax=Arthrobacter tumbae TaxID=163874 RepID=UPI00195EF9EF|nr:GNAT family N-acetyltransferase [Arthrobacter tumbae]MBM7781839.1 putative acetyltransferase [Arthrobacter tumbae]